MDYNKPISVTIFVKSLLKTVLRTILVIYFKRSLLDSSFRPRFKIKIEIVLLIIIGTLLKSNLQSYGQIKLTLQQAIDSSVARNLQIKKAKSSELISYENVRQSRLNQLPAVSFNVQSSINWGRTLDVSTYNYVNQGVFLTNSSLGAQLALFQGGQLRKQIVQNKLLLEADESNIEKVKFDVILSTATVFLQALNNIDLLEVAGQQVSLADQNALKAQKEFDAGKKNLSDLAQAQSQKAITELDQATIKNQLEESMLNLRQLIQIPEMRIELIKPPILYETTNLPLIDTTIMIRMALAANAEIKTAHLQREAMFQGIKVAKSALYPSISLFSSLGSNFSNARTIPGATKQAGVDTIGLVTRTNDYVVAPVYASTPKKYSLLKQFSDNFYHAAGITIQIPIFNRLEAQTNMRKANILYKDGQLSEQISIDNLKRVFKQAIADLATARKRLDAALENSSATTKMLYSSKKRYEVGLLNSIDYNIAITNNNKAQFALIQARYDIIFRNQIINFYVGKPLSF